MFPVIFVFAGTSGFIAKLRKATISVFMSVRLAVHMERLDSHGTYFDEISYFGSRIFVDKIQISLKFDKNDVFYMKFSHM